MNWLSHIYLSPDDIDFRLGNLLADTLRGQKWKEAPASFVEGVAMHRAIDTFTDRHPVFLQSKARLGERGYLKGVVVDVLYDHFLSRLWDEYGSQPRDAYIAAFHRDALEAVREYPARQRYFVETLVASNRLAQYGSFEGFVSTLDRLERRLSERIRRRECLSDYLPAVRRSYRELEEDFRGFFPEAVAFVESRAGRLKVMD